jgi:hypothetical protein
MVGEARLTAQGSGGAALPLGGAAVPDGGLAALLGALEPVAEEVVLACGVLASVEFPEPQASQGDQYNDGGPVTGSARQGSDHVANRPVIAPAGGGGHGRVFRGRCSQLRCTVIGAIDQVLWKDISASRWMRICLAGLMATYTKYNGYIGRIIRYRGYSFHRRSSRRWPPSESIAGALASGNVAAADPATGVASAASDEVSTAIAAFVFVRCCPIRKR